MQLETYTMDAATFMQQANQVKEALIEAMERDGLLTKPATEIMINYAIVITKPGWLGSFFKNMLHSDGAKLQNLRIDVVKAV
jgi:hypothetical protein